MENSSAVEICENLKKKKTKVKEKKNKLQLVKVVLTSDEAVNAESGNFLSVNPSGDTHTTNENVNAALLLNDRLENCY